MSFSGFRNKITNFITSNGSTVVITPRTLAAGSYGGYEPGTTTAGTAVSTIGISSNYSIFRSGQVFGKLQEGEIVLFLKYSETIAKDYKITWQSSTYTIKEIEEIRAGNLLICYKIMLSRRLDS